VIAAIYHLRLAVSTQIAEVTSSHAI
jgi:hypothetical protein